MKVIQDLLDRGNVTVAVTANDLKVFALDLVEMAKQELKQQITDANTETYLSPDQVCKMLDVDRTTLWRWDKKGYLCPVEVGGKRRYPMSKINIMLKGGRYMNHYDDFFKEQYDRIQRKLDKIAGDFIYSRQLPEDMFIDNPKFMELMGISQKTAQAWRDKGTISYSQVGNKIYYRISDIKELLERFHIKAIRKEDDND